MGGFHHHHHHHHRRVGMRSPLVGYYPPSRPAAGRPSRLFVFFIFVGIFFLAATPILLAIYFVTPGQCPTNHINCEECTTAMNMTYVVGNLTSNHSSWRIVEFCWERISWGNLTANQQSYWKTLGQSQSTWDAHQNVGMCWDDLDSTELTAAESLGYDGQKWDWDTTCGNTGGADYYYYDPFYYSYYYSSYYYSSYVYYYYY